MIGRVYRFHDQGLVVAFAQTAAGRLVILGTAVMLLIWHDAGHVAELQLQDSYWITIAAIGAMFLFPLHGRLMLSLASFCMLLVFSLGVPETDFSFSNLQPGTREFEALLRRIALAVGVMAILFGTFLVMKRFDDLPAPVRKYPVVSFHLAALAGLVLIWVAPPLSFLLHNAWLIPLLIWRIGYMILYASHGKMRNSRFRDHLFYLLPIYGGGNLTPGKGLGHLERHEAAAGEALARSQLSGLRLLMIGIVWYWAHELMQAAVYGDQESLFMPLLSGWTLDMPLLNENMADAASSTELAWISIYLELFRTVLAWAAWGAMIIGALRLLGFNVFRNTYKPLLATNLLDYWSRINYYFKEACVDFFFYPTFMRCGWAGPRLRLFIAVFAAAFLGNLYYHVLLYPHWTLTVGWAAVWEYWSPRLIYCFLLAGGIWVSMLRQQTMRRGGSGTSQARLIRARRLLGVWTFYALIHIWNIPSDSVAFEDRMRIVAALLGL